MTGPISNWPIDAGEYNSTLTGKWTRGLLIRRNIADEELTKPKHAAPISKRECNCNAKVVYRGANERSYDCPQWSTTRATRTLVANRRPMFCCGSFPPKTELDKHQENEKPRSNIDAC
jgi:hypothetical protein